MISFSLFTKRQNHRHSSGSQNPYTRCTEIPWEGQRQWLGVMNHKCLLQQSQATLGAVCLLSDSLHSSQVLLHTTKSKCTLSIHMQCHKIQAHAKAWPCLYHFGLKRQTAALKHGANISHHVLLSAGNSETKAKQKQIHKIRLVLEMNGDAHRHEPWCKNTATKRENFFWHWHSAWITLTFPYDPEAWINSAMHLE